MGWDLFSRIQNGVGIVCREIGIWIGHMMCHTSFISGSLIRLIVNMGVLSSMLIMFVQINIMLAVFNMIPIPPLDGSQIFSGLMIRHNPDLVVKLQIYGPQILMGLILFGMLTSVSPIWWLMSPFVNFFMFLFVGI